MSVPYGTPYEPVPADDAWDDSDDGEMAAADELLEIARDLVHAHVEHPLTPEQAGELVNAFDLLDALLCAGEALPAEWADAGKGQARGAEGSRAVEELPPL